MFYSIIYIPFLSPVICVWTVSRQTEFPSKNIIIHSFISWGKTSRWNITLTNGPGNSHPLWLGLGKNGSCQMVVIYYWISLPSPYYQTTAQQCATPVCPRCISIAMPYDNRDYQVIWLGERAAKWLGFAGSPVCKQLKLKDSTSQTDMAGKTGGVRTRADR